MCDPTPAASVTLPVALSSGRLARRFLEEHWCASHASADLEQAHLLVTELVTNAVRHGGPPIELEVCCTGADGVTLSVSDGSSEQPAAHDVDACSTGGRGVRLVDLLSAEWGVAQHPSPGGPAKTVWCRLVA